MRHESKYEGVRKREIRGEREKERDTHIICVIIIIHEHIMIIRNSIVPSVVNFILHQLYSNRLEGQTRTGRRTRQEEEQQEEEERVEGEKKTPKF